MDNQPEPTVTFHKYPQRFAQTIACTNKFPSYSPAAVLSSLHEEALMDRISAAAAAIGSSQQQQGAEAEEATSHHLTVPAGLTEAEFSELTQFVLEFHRYSVGQGKCSSLLAQRVHGPRAVVWSIVRRFDKPQVYKHFIKACSVDPDFHMAVGCTRYVDVISGLPALTSTERLDILDDERFVMGFSIIGGEHRLRNYRSVATVHEVAGSAGDEISTIVLESYVVDVPEGNTEEDTRLFADTVVKLNLQKLASVAESLARGADA